MTFTTIAGSAPLRGVVVGAGALGPHWGFELHHSGDVELAGWVDLVPERAAAAAAGFGARDTVVGADAAAMLDALAPDFLVNVSPPTAHHAITLAALERGVHVLSEKPMAATLPQARDMIAAADRNQRLLMVSQNRRYYPGLIAFRETVAQLGRLSNLTCQFFIAHRDDAAEFLLAFPDPLLLDMAIHLFDGARAITGADPVSVYCEASNPPWSWYAGDAAADAIFTMTGGLRFTFTGNWAGPGFRTSWTGSWRATGERGSALWEDEGAPVVSPADGETLTAVAPAELVRGPERFPGLEFSLAEFVDALRTGRTPAGECHDNLRSLAMCHAAVESARTGRRVAVEAYPRGMSGFEPGDVVRVSHPDSGEPIEGTYLAMAEPDDLVEVDGEGVETAWVELDDGETRRFALDGVRAV